MAVEIMMPNLSQTTDEVKLVKWLVEEGDKVKKGDMLCEVETDKVNMEVESFADGTVLKINTEEGRQVKTGEVIAVLGEAGEEIEKTQEEKNDKAFQYKNQITKETEPKIRATKLVERLADKSNVDLAMVKGTGPGGTITKADLEDYIKGIASTDVNEQKSFWELSPNRQAVSANLSRSKKEIPHFYLKAEVSAEEIIASRNSAEGENKLSFYSYLVYCSAKALKKFPQLNGYFKDNRIYKNSHINIGIAVASGDELFVPVIKDASEKTLNQIDSEVKRLAAKAQNKKLEPADISGGTYTITNLGIYPVDEFYGVINYPQAALLAVGKIRKVLKVDEAENISIKSVFNITISFDHRIANGAIAASFLGQVKKLLEEV